MTKHNEGSPRKRRRVGWIIGIGLALGGAIGIAVGLLWPTAAKVGSVTNQAPTVGATVSTPTTLPPSAPPSPSDFLSLQGLPDELMQVGCQNPGGTTEWKATAWPYGPPGNAVTASHFAQSCGVGSTIVMERAAGQETGTLTRNDPTHDLASYILTPVDEAPRPLSTSTAYVGQEVALVGFPSGSNNPARNPTRICYGRISALHQTQTLVQPVFNETLTDAITVNSLSCATKPGMSGGAAFDTSGDVVGVIEGGGGPQAVLTPVQDLPPG